MRTRKDGCLFCQITPSRVVEENDLGYVVIDRFPVANGHTLVIPKRHVADYFELHNSEVVALHDMLRNMKKRIEIKDELVTGFNIGINCGKDAGQSVFHAHIHLIPRRKDDVQDPRGGVRGVIPLKQKY